MIPSITRHGDIVVLCTTADLRPLPQSKHITLTATPTQLGVGPISISELERGISRIEALRRIVAMADIRIHALRYGAPMGVFRRSSDRGGVPEQPSVAMDGKVVGRALREEIRPLLREVGFTQFTDRKAWRETEHTIDHVTFRSLNAYNAGVFGCPSYSLTVEVGVFYRGFDPGKSRPQDYDCTFRAILAKTIRQPIFGSTFMTRHGHINDCYEILYVQPDGSNLHEVVAEAKALLEVQGLPFLDHFNQPEKAFQSLMTERMIDGDFGQPTLMFPGNPDSPNWHESSLLIGRLVREDPRDEIRTAPVLNRK